jgi:L-lactate dehydrogenase complex protein LldG
MPDARTVILERIRNQLDAGQASNRPAYEEIPREYLQAGRRSLPDRIELLLDRLEDYDAEVFTVEESAIAETVAAVLAQHGETALLVPAEVPAAWLPAGPEILRDEAGSLAMLTRAQAVLTPCAGAIAETGTILLEHGAQQGRRAATLLPDHHICILRTNQIVETVSEGLALLAAASASAITTISGPSATADIEMTRIRGVHGPRRLSVLLIPA